jgi:lipoate---protein ligase
MSDEAQYACAQWFEAPRGWLRMESLRFIRSEHTYADFSTSVSPALERALEEGRSGSTVVLNVFPEDSITIGILDDPEKCLDLDFCRKAGIVVRRRRNTGGAILGAKGSALLVMGLDTRLPWVSMKTLNDGFRIGLEAMAGALYESFGIDAMYRPVNDVEVAGRKLIASSVRLENHILTLRALLNVSPVNREILTGAMVTPPEKMADKGIRDAAERVTCLEREAGRVVAEEEVTAVTERTLRKVFGEGIAVVPGDLNPAEREFASVFEAQYASDEWLYANSERSRFKDIPCGAVRAEGLHKAPAGLIRATLLLLDARIRDVIITGDFHPRPLEIVGDIEAAIRGVEPSAETIRARIRSILSRPGVEIPGATPEDFAAAFEKALSPTR